jgi:hypothetical protein
MTDRTNRACRAHRTGRPDCTVMACDTRRACRTGCAPLTDRACRAGWAHGTILTSFACGANRTRWAHSTGRSDRTHGACRTHVSDWAFGTLFAGSTGGACRALRAHRAGRACVAGGALRTCWADDAIFTHRACRASLTLRTCRAGRACCTALTCGANRACGSDRTIMPGLAGGACRADQALRTLRACRAGIAFMAGGTDRACRTRWAHRARLTGCTIMTGGSLGACCAVMSDGPGRAHRANRACGAHRTDHPLNDGWYLDHGGHFDNCGEFLHRARDQLPGRSRDGRAGGRSGGCNLHCGFGLLARLVIVTAGHQASPLWLSQESDFTKKKLCFFDKSFF